MKTRPFLSIRIILCTSLVQMLASVLVSADFLKGRSWYTGLYLHMLSECFNKQHAVGYDRVVLI